MINHLMLIQGIVFKEKICMINILLKDVQDHARNLLFIIVFFNSVAFNVIVLGGRGELILFSGSGTQLFII